VPYDRAEAKQRALAQANGLLLPLIAGGRRLAVLRLALSLGHTNRLVHVHSTRDMRVHIVVVDLPASHPLVVAVYSSTQESRPTSPQQFAKRLARLRREVGKLRHRLFEQADILYVYLSPKGLTRGSTLRALREGVIFSSSPLEARKRLAGYLAKRYRRLITKIASTKVWGELPLLAYALNLLSRTLRNPHPTTSETHNIIGVLENAVKGLYTGEELAKLLPPP
jgi:hypothetical protein